MRVRDSLSDAVSSQLGFISSDALFNNHWLPSDHVLPIICPSKPRCNIFKDQGSCLYRKLNSTIMLVEATHDRLRCDATFVLNSTMVWSVFAKSSMGPQLVVVGSILRQDPA
jgi:hypothetical protein